MALDAPLPKPGGSLLIGQLEQSKGRLEAVDENELDIMLIDHRVYLVEKFHIEVFGKVLIGH